MWSKPNTILKRLVARVVVDMIKRLAASGRKISETVSSQKASESGQSIVVAAEALIVLLAITGLAIDVGFIYARLSKLTTAVDASALAGVTELNRGPTEKQDAVNRGAEFLHANSLPG